MRKKFAAVLVSISVAGGVSGCADPLTRIVTQESAPPPIVVTVSDNNKQIDMILGQSAFLEDLGVPINDIYIESADTAIAYPVQPSDAQGATGFLAVGEGGVIVTVWESFPTAQTAVPLMTLRVLVTSP